MTVESWLQAALADADKRGLPELKALLEGAGAGNARAAKRGLRRSRGWRLTMTLAVHEFARKLRAREISAVEMTDECLRVIEAENPRLNAFILVMADEARRQAQEADRELGAGRDRGALHGVPFSVKDLFDVRGTPTTAASRVRDGHIAADDAPAIALLRQAGVVFVGKTNLHEFAFGTTNEDSAFGPARNPHDLTRSPGGSSGGSAASVAAGMALATLGTDTGGSIRIPAAACGIVGLKPTYGEIQTDGIVPLSRTLDHAGPLTRDVTDAWHVYHALLGRPRPGRCRPRPSARSVWRRSADTSATCSTTTCERGSKRRWTRCAKPEHESTKSASLMPRASSRSICTSF